MPDNVNPLSAVFNQEPVRVLCVNHLLYYINFGIFAAMEQMGYDVQILPLGNYYEQNQADLLLSVLERFQPHLIFTPGWSVEIFATQQFLDIISNYSAPHIYWATEDPLFFDDVSMVFAPYSDYVFTTASECNKKYHDMGIPSSTMLFACNPFVFKPMPPRPEYQHDIILVASNYFWFPDDKDYRRQTIKNLVIPLVEAGYDLKVWGAGWTDPEADYTIDQHYCGGYLPYLLTPYAYSSAKIVLGLQSVNTSPTQTSTRTYEIMGCGAFHLAPYTPSYQNLFKKHHHLVWSNSPQETLELVDYYLKHDQEREAIAHRGRAEVLRRHTYFNRVKQMEEDLLNYFQTR